MWKTTVRSKSGDFGDLVKVVCNVSNKMQQGGNREEGLQLWTPNLIRPLGPGDFKDAQSFHCHFMVISLSFHCQFDHFFCLERTSPLSRYSIDMTSAFAKSLRGFGMELEARLSRCPELL